MAVQLMPECDCFFVVGEPSGDAYGAVIWQSILEAMPGLTAAAMGGEKMQASGMEIEQHIDGLAVMGFWPVIQRLPFFIQLGRQVEKIIRQRKPKVVVTIDYPGFNLRLLGRLQDLRSQGVKLIHIVAPQVWAWKPKRAKKVARLVDDCYCFFPFEPRLFHRHGGKARFVGHPLVDMIPSLDACRQLRRKHGWDERDRVILLAPGSRRKEVLDLLPVLDAAAKLAAPQLSAPAGAKIHFVVSKTPDLPRNLYRQFTEFPLIEGDYAELCAVSFSGLITSGTATLQAALAGLPHVIAYVGDPFSVAVARKVVLTNHLGLPNIVHGQRVCAELMLHECNPVRLAARLIQLNRTKKWQSVHDVLATTAEKLGGGGALRYIADCLQAELQTGPGSQRKDTSGDSSVVYDDFRGSK